MADFEFYGLKIPVSLSMFADVRDVCSRLRESGTNNAFCIIDPAYRTFFEENGWKVAGLRGSDSEVGRAFLLMRRLLNHSGDGVSPTQSVVRKTYDYS